MGVSHKGAISLGLLYIPVALYTTTRDNDIRFNQFCKDTKERVKYKKYCPSCNKEVKTEEIIKGYEYEAGKYVVMTQDELEKIKTKKDKTIHIIQFVTCRKLKAKKLEGVIAKKKDSKYYFDKRTKDWIKFKFLADEDFVICGYIIKEKGNHQHYPRTIQRKGINI